MCSSDLAAGGGLSENVPRQDAVFFPQCGNPGLPMPGDGSCKAGRGFGRWRKKLGGAFGYFLQGHPAEFTECTVELFSYFSEQKVCFAITEVVKLILSFPVFN